MNQCPICKSRNVRPYWTHKDMILDICSCCKIIFQNKNSLAKENRELISKIYEKYKEKFEEHIKINNSRIKKIERYLNHELYGMKILEIGCGNGALGSLLIEKGNEYFAFEAYQVFYKNLKKTSIPQKNIFFSEFDIKKIKGMKFNIIIMNDVIEHIYDPLALIKDLKEFLEENGIIWIEIPDESLIKIKGMIRILMKMYINGYPTNPDHKILFNKKTFFNFLKNTGYKIENYEIDSVWGNQEKLSLVFDSKIPLYIKALSYVLKFTSLDKIIGASLIGILKK